MRMIPMRLAAVLAAVALSLDATAVAEGLPEGHHSTIQLQSRVFDLGTEARRIRRDADFIPISRVNWIRDLADSGPCLHPTVIHIRTRAHLPGRWVWPPDEDRGRYAPAPDLADAWALEDFEARWHRAVAPMTRGDMVLFPKFSAIEYYVSCGYDRKGRVPTFCAAHALYPPDPSLRILVRIYRITDPLNLIYCLDVTEAVRTGAWRPSRTGKPADLAGYAATCKEVHS